MKNLKKFESIFDNEVDNDIESVDTIYGIPVTVYTPASGDDFSARGVTSKNTRLMLVGDDVSQQFKVKPGEIYLKLIKPQNPIYSIRAVPVGEEGRNEHSYMFGGNFIYSSDSRFREISKYPIPVHDRYEF